MKIQILKINKLKPIFAPGTKNLGYLTTFKSDFVQGKAIIVPAIRAEHNLQPGNIIYVETHQEGIRNLQELKPEIQEQMISLESQCDYHICGTTMDKMPPNLLTVQVADANFNIIVSEEWMGIELGKKVTFDLNGLSLWDMNI